MNTTETRALWVDDCKPCPNGYAVARTFLDALCMLSRYDYDELYLDHDLGGNETGYDLLKQIHEDGRLPRRVTCISWNPVGRKRIMDALGDFGYAEVGEGMFEFAGEGPTIRRRGENDGA